MNRALCDREASRRLTRTCFVLVVLMALSVAPTGLLGSSQASAHIDLGFEQGAEPQNGLFYPLDEDLSMEVKVRNNDASQAYNAVRALDWMFCADDHAVDGCDPNATLMSGSTWVLNIGPGMAKTVTIGEFSPTESGEYTLEAMFVESDVDVSNDNIRIVFSIVDDFIDFQLDLDHDVLPDLAHLNIIDENRIYNTGTNYPISFNGTVENWPTPSTAQIGWRLWNGTTLISEAYAGTQDFPTEIQTATYFSFDAPGLLSPASGVFTLEYGMLTAGEDLNLENNINQIQVVFDDTLDVVIGQPVPLVDPMGESMYASSNALKIEVRNTGNVSVFNYVLKFEQLGPTGLYLDQAQLCTDLDLDPTESVDCYFDLFTPGDVKLKFTIPESFDIFTDANLSDNTLEIPVEVLVGNISAQIIQSRQDAIYTLQDEIHLVASVNALAPRPLTYSWIREGGWSFGTGEEIYINALNLGSGDKFFTLQITDALNRVEYVDLNLTIMNTTAFEYGGNMIHGIAPARSNAHVDIDFSIIDPFSTYEIAEGLDPLYTFSLDVVVNLEPLEDPGLERIDMTLDLDKLLPVEVEDNSTIQIYRLDPTGEAAPTLFEGEDIIFDALEGELNIFTEEEGAFLVAAEFGRVNLSIDNISVTPGKAGSMTLTWDVIGDEQTPWLLEWHIFRATGTGLSLIPFNALDRADAETWDALTADKLVDTKSLTEDPIPTSAENQLAILCIDGLDSGLNETQRAQAELECNTLEFDQRWEDPQALGPGVCSSYVIVAKDRQGRYQWTNGAVSAIDMNGDGQAVCGDNEPPFVKVTLFDAQVVYDSSEQCLSDNADYSRCYTVELTWNWPLSISEPVSFNLYRTEQYTNDLRFAYPMATFDIVVPGARVQWTDSGTNEILSFTDGTREDVVIDLGVRPDRVYYYYLTPIDAIGNEGFEPIPGNWLEVEVDEVEVVETHPDWIPPEPEPPETVTGTDYEVKLQEYLAKPSFQIAGLVSIITICANFILIPISLQKRKRASRLIEHLIDTGQWDEDDGGEDDW